MKKNDICKLYQQLIIVGYVTYILRSHGRQSGQINRVGNSNNRRCGTPNQNTGMMTICCRGSGIKMKNKNIL
jgi:hypothetical protein